MIMKNEATQDQVERLFHLLNMPGFAGEFAKSIVLRWKGTTLFLSPKQAALIEKLADETSATMCDYYKCPNCVPDYVEE